MKKLTNIFSFLILALSFGAGAHAAEQAADEFGAMFGQEVPQALIDLARENDNIMLDYYTGEDLSAIEPAAGDEEPVNEDEVLESLERVRANSDGHVIIDRVRAE